MALLAMRVAEGERYSVTNCVTDEIAITAIRNYAIRVHHPARPPGTCADKLGLDEPERAA